MRRLKWESWWELKLRSGLCFCSGYIYSFSFLLFLFIQVCFLIAERQRKRIQSKQNRGFGLFLSSARSHSPTHTYLQHTHTQTQTYFSYIVFYVSNLLWLDTLATISDTLWGMLTLGSARLRAGKPEAWLRNEAGAGGLVLGRSLGPKLGARLEAGGPEPGKTATREGWVSGGEGYTLSPPTPRREETDPNTLPGGKPKCFPVVWIVLPSSTSPSLQTLSPSSSFLPSLSFLTLFLNS